MVQQPSYWKVLTRRKIYSTEGAETETKLNRVLGLFDLTALGVGSTLGAGVYILAGQIAKEQAGPSVVISFAIAALASLLAGVCYAEFGARVPKAGSAYVYSYVCIGEFAAFVIGWNLILEYVIGTAAVCRGISLYLDSLINDTLKTTFAEVAPIQVSFLGSYFDILAFGLVIVFGVALAFGVETSAMANNFCCCLNISILLFVIIAGSIKADFSNWAIDVTVVNATTISGDITSNLGSGGFFPFGFSGTLQGAATCFFGFVGFDCIATTGEEVRNPRKNIPQSILLSLLVIFLCYFGVSMVLTLMVPYYRQDPNAPLPYAFKEVGWDFAMWIVSIGGLIGLLASLFGALFPLPRIMYSMAEDGLIFHFLGKVSPRFQVPVVGSIFAAILTGLIAGLFDLAQLVSLLSIGTLLAYSVVAISITILRYMDNSGDCEKMNENSQICETTMLTNPGTKVSFNAVLGQMFNCERLRKPNTISTRIVGTLITIFCLLSLGIGLVLMLAYDDVMKNEIWALVLLGILVGLTVLVLLIICLQPREIFTPLISVFRVPFVPIVPAASMFINIYLMLQLDAMTWIRFGVWMIIGIPLYFACYCMYNLKIVEKRNPKRIEFKRALRASGTNVLHINNDENDIRNGNGNGFIPNNLESLGMSKSSNGKSVGNVSQNQLSLRSLDEIVNMSEIGEELIEMRHPNGKVFYIEDTRSNTSTVTCEHDENGMNGNGNDRNNGNDCDEVSEEEKSVIALLDDVLQGEDDGGGGLPTPTHMGIHDYGRKFSIDSELLPSVIETTIVATVHSSSDSSEQDLDDVPEDCEEQAGLGTTNVHVPSLSSPEYRNECERIAQILINDILANDAIQNALIENIKNIGTLENVEKENINDIIQRKISETSKLSIESSSIDDPMHSEKFKNKLSRLILQPPSNNPTKILKDESEEDEEILDNIRPVLKHSKSEAEVPMVTNGNVNGIPNPPKFDPILYKTINSLNTKRVRPSLDKLMAAAETKKDEIKVIQDDSMPFKTKLEAILKRGPSHRTQQRPDVQIRERPLRPKTMIEITPKENIRSMSAPKRNSITEISAEQLILNTRKTLRRVQNSAIMS